jgi:hypothetical protein
LVELGLQVPQEIAAQLEPQVAQPPLATLALLGTKVILEQLELVVQLDSPGTLALLEELVELGPLDQPETRVILEPLEESEELAPQEGLEQLATPEPLDQLAP